MDAWLCSAKTARASSWLCFAKSTLLALAKILWRGGLRWPSHNEPRPWLCFVGVRSLGVRSCRLPRLALRGAKRRFHRAGSSFAADNIAGIISLFLLSCQDKSYMMADTGPAGPLRLNHAGRCLMRASARSSEPRHLVVRIPARELKHGIDDIADAIVRLATAS
jgi:hypothetical protein